MRKFLVIPAQAGIQRKKNWIPAFAGMTAVLAFFCAAIPAHAEPAPRQITVTGNAEQSFSPDKADVFVVVEGRGKTLAEAKQKHDELLNALHRVVAKFGVDKTKVKTLSNSINPQYDYVNEPNGSGRQVLRGYQAEHRLAVTLAKLNTLGEFINAIVAQNIDRVEQVSYGLKDSKTAESETMLAAVKNAKDKARSILGALDASLGDVLSVNTNGGGYQPVPMPMAMMAKGADMAVMGSAPEAAPVPSGDVSIRQNVTVQFEIQ